MTYSCGKVIKEKYLREKRTVISLDKPKHNSLTDSFLPYCISTHILLEGGGSMCTKVEGFSTLEKATKSFNHRR